MTEAALQLCDDLMDSTSRIGGTANVPSLHPDLWYMLHIPLTKCSFVPRSRSR